MQEAAHVGVGAGVHINAEGGHRLFGRLPERIIRKVRVGLPD